MKTLIIIPTYNEYDNLRPLLDAIFSNAPVTDVLIVDDNSPDGTGKLADDIHEEDPRVHVLHRAGKLGLGTAYVAGFKYSIEHNYDAAFEMDADFSHDRRLGPELPSGTPPSPAGSPTGAGGISVAPAPAVSDRLNPTTREDDP